MKRIGLYLLAVAIIGMAGCGGGEGNSDSGEFDPTGSEWQFLVATADAGDTMYTLSFFDSTGAKAVSGLFTAVSAAGASYSGSWTSSDNTVTGASSGNFAFTLNVNTDTTGTIDYVTPEGSGSSAAIRTDTITANCSQYAGNWVMLATITNCMGGPTSLTLQMTIGSDCSATFCEERCHDSQVVGNIVTFSFSEPDCGGTSTVAGAFTSASSLSGGTISGTTTGSWSATKQ